MNLRQIARRWENVAQEKQFTELDRVKTTASSWLGYISILIGAISIAGLTVKPDALETISPDKEIWIQGAIIVITILYLAAVTTAIIAIRPIPIDTYSNGGSYEEYSSKAIKDTWFYLEWSRISTILAMATLLVTSVVVLLDKPPATPLYFLANMGKDGVRHVYCGQLITKNGKSFLGTKPLEGVITLTPVTKCN